MLNARPSSSYYLMGVYSYVEAFRVTQYGRGAAVSVVLVVILMFATFFYVRQMLSTLTSVPVVTFFLLVQRHVTSGLTAGAVKG